MEAQPKNDPLEREEHLFLLELGDEWTRLLYAKLELGMVVLLDGFCEVSCGVESGVPVDVKATSEVLRGLFRQCERKHELQIQTLYVLIKSSPSNDIAHRVTQAQPYLEFLDRERRGLKTFSNAHLNKIAFHSDLFDAFDSEHEAFRYAFALPSRMREAIHDSLIGVECFVEGFLSLPRIGVKSRTQMHPGLVLGIFAENSIVMAAMGDDLPFYRELPFGLNKMVEKVAQRFELDRNRARRVLSWVINPPTVGTFDLGRPEDEGIYFSEKFSQLRNDIADELERLTMSIRQDMENSGFGISALTAFIYWVRERGFITTSPSFVTSCPLNLTLCRFPIKTPSSRVIGIARTLLLSSAWWTTPLSSGLDCERAKGGTTSLRALKPGRGEFWEPVFSFLQKNRTF